MSERLRPLPRHHIHTPVITAYWTASGRAHTCMHRRQTSLNFSLRHSARTHTPPVIEVGSNAAHNGRMLMLLPLWPPVPHSLVSGANCCYVKAAGTWHLCTPPSPLLPSCCTVPHPSGTEPCLLTADTLIIFSTAEFTSITSACL